METENVRKPLKISLNIWKIVLCIENAYINHKPKIACIYNHYFRVTLKSKYA